MTDSRDKILIVDDEPANLQLLEGALRDEYELFTSMNGFDAIDQVIEQIPDLILLDVMMPDLDGFDVCRTIKSDETFSSIPIIFLTSMESQEGEIKGLSAGGIDYLRKPINIKLLKLRIQNHMELKRYNDLIREQRDLLAQQKEQLAEMMVELEEKNRQQLAAEKENLALQQQLHQAQKFESLGVLAGGIAHDFNNIFQIIIGNCALIRMEYGNADKSFEHINKAVQNAADLCSQMLAYAGKSPISQTKFNLWMLLDEMTKMLHMSLDQNVTLYFEGSPDTGDTFGDISQIRQVVMNLIINATEAIGTEQGTISILLDRAEIPAEHTGKDCLGKPILPGRYLRMVVSDTGCGMNEETVQRIFEPFYSTKFAGRGLGMAAVLGIITAHKGSLQLESRLGQGAAVTVYLPVLIEEPAEVAPLKPAPPAPPLHGSGTILLVDDERKIRTTTAKYLSTAGFTVIEAKNGKEALELYQDNSDKITVVLTDLGMPVMDGYTMFRELKKINPDLPIVVSSGFGDAEVVSRLNREEIAGLVSKPYTFERLSKVLQEVLMHAP